MFYFRLTLDAQSDLIDIRRYTLANWGRQQTDKYLTQLRQAIRLLAENPTLGRARPDVSIGVFSFFCHSHVC